MVHPDVRRFVNFAQEALPNEIYSEACFIFLLHSQNILFFPAVVLSYVSSDSVQYTLILFMLLYYLRYVSPGALQSNPRRMDRFKFARLRLL
jgi:hypothetical protein